MAWAEADAAQVCGPFIIVMLQEILMMVFYLRVKVCFTRRSAARTSHAAST
jgi:hypothetical protein